MTIPRTMRVLEMTGLNRLELVERPVPVVGPGEVLIRTQATTICTSDIVDLTENAFGGPIPRILGHEGAGVIAALGADVNPLRVGQRVAAHPVFPCGTCRNCRRGLGHLCLEMGHLGLNRPGTFAEYFRAPADRVAAVPDSLDAALAALLEPAAVCLQSLRRGLVQAGTNVLILGDGPFGVLTARLARRRNAHVAVVGGHPFRSEKACAELVLHHESPEASVLKALEQWAGPDGVDTAILCVSSPKALALASTALRTRGRLVVFSAIAQPAAVDWFRVHVKELEIVGSCNDEEALDDIVPLLSDERLALSELITHRLPLEQYEQGFQLASHAKETALKVAFVMENAA